MHTTDHVNYLGILFIGVAQAWKISRAVNEFFLIQIVLLYAHAILQNSIGDRHSYGTLSDGIEINMLN